MTKKSRPTARSQATEVRGIPLAYPVTRYVKKVSWKEDGAELQCLDGIVLAVPYPDLLTVERQDSKLIRVSYIFHSQWSLPATTGRKRVNKHIVRYERANGRPLFVKESEDGKGST